MYVCMYVYACIRVYVRVRVYVRMHVWVFSMHLYLFDVWLHATVFGTRLVRSGPVAVDSDPIQIRAVVDPIQ